MENTFAANLRRIRKERGITQEQLAEAVGVSAQAVSKWEMSSYPDAQLLLAIADKLGVTIDELYGRTHEDKSIYQRVLEHIKETPVEERTPKALNICRAIIEAHTGAVEFAPIHETILNATSWSTYSQNEDEYGFMQMRNNKNLQYFVMLPEPENGYDDVLRYDEGMVKLFGFLSEPNALRAMYLLTGRDNTFYFRKEMLIKKLDISPENAQKIIDEMLDLGFIWKATLDSGGDNENIYNYTKSKSFIGLMLFTWLLLHEPNSFNYERNDRKNGRYFKNDTYKREAPT